MSDPASRAAILSWRKAQLSRLIAGRLAVSHDDRSRYTAELTLHLSEFTDSVPGGGVSFYWPFRGEPDIRLFGMSSLLSEASPSLMSPLRGNGGRGSN